MLALRNIRRVVGLRFYGFEDPNEKMGQNWWQYSEFTNFGDKDPEQRGFQWDPATKERTDAWKKGLPVNYQSRKGQGGVNYFDILEQELNENPLGDYDTNMHAIPKPEIKTRILHILRHFNKVNLKQLTWSAHMEDELKLDSLERTALLVSVEDEFKILFEDNVFDNLNTLDEVVEYVSTERYAY